MLLNLLISLEFCVKTLMYRCWRLKKAPQFDIILLCFSFNSFFCKIFLQIFFFLFTSLCSNEYVLRHCIYARDEQCIRIFWSYSIAGR